MIELNSYCEVQSDPTDVSTHSTDAVCAGILFRRFSDWGLLDVGAVVVCGLSTAKGNYKAKSR